MKRLETKKWNNLPLVTETRRVKRPHTTPSVLYSIIFFGKFYWVYPRPWLSPDTVTGLPPLTCKDLSLSVCRGVGTSFRIPYFGLVPEVPLVFPCKFYGKPPSWLRTYWSPTPRNEIIVPPNFGILSRIQVDGVERVDSSPSYWYMVGVPQAHSKFTCLFTDWPRIFIIRESVITDDTIEKGSQRTKRSDLKKDLSKNILLTSLNLIVYITKIGHRPVLRVLYD